jgi:ferritin-like metal-binding protein YciE
MAPETLNDLLMDGLRDMYHAEQQAEQALPHLARAASNPALGMALEDHLEETRRHVQRLEEAFQLLGAPARGKRCKGMEGLLEEGRELLESGGSEAVLDAGIIAGAQKVEHYEIAAYGCLITWAETLGEDEVAHLLEQNLAEEKAADEHLTHLAKEGVNALAARGNGAG